MPDIYYYKDALKLGQKEYRACLSKGISPCLSALDDFIPVERSMAGTDLGLVQIPSEFIVGTKTRGRVNSFAPNFMPVLDVGTEFADKWERLCQAHLDEGIREPIRAYEYLNRFYVEEGNKRVSVLKFFGAPEITGHVIRVMPERTAETERYYEFVDFYKLSRINSVEFSKSGSYKTLQKLMGKLPEEAWTEEERKQFATTYYCFRQAYELSGGTKLHSTVGDAMLAYMQIYGCDSLRGKTVRELQETLPKVWEEIALQQEAEPIDVKLTPQEKKQSLIQKVVSGGESRHMNVAFIHDGRPDISAWTRGHERGREYVQRVMDDAIHTTAYFDAMMDEPDAIIRKAVADGNKVLFTTSPRLLTASLRTAVEHPEVTIFNCSLNTSHRYIRTYYARMYEVKFIIGAVAGSLAGGDPVGYLADYPIFGQIAGINAFALGVQMVNPRAEIYLEWSTVGGADAALKRLTDRGVRLISSQDLARVGREGSSSLGLSLISDGERVNLATPLWQWGTYYEQLLRLIRNRSVQSEYSESHRALNYYWGLSAGVVELRCSEKLPPSVVKLAELLQNGIRTGVSEPFRGPLYSQDGKVLEAERSLTPDQIINMDWLMENVVGSIPGYNELSEIGKATVDMVGISKVFKNGRG